MCLRVVLALAVILFLGKDILAAVNAKSDGVVAEQAGVQLTINDIDAFAAGIPEQLRAGYFSSPTRIENLIMNLLVSKQLTAAARASGLDNDPQVQLQLERAAEEALSKAQLQHYRENLALPDMEVLAQEEYLANRSRYARPANVSVQHVLVATKGRGVDEARARAEEVRSKALEAPESFEELVREYSDDPSSESNQGRMDDADNPKRYVLAFAEAAGALRQPGEISPLVETPFGFHVLKLLERRTAQPRAYDEVKAEIIERLEKEFVERKMREYTDRLRNQPLDANPELVASLRDRYGVAEEVGSATEPSDP